MTRAGTASYMAPELRTHKYNEKVDVYSFGMVVGNLKNEMSSLDRDQGEFLEELCEKCKKHDPAKRPSFTEVIGILDKARNLFEMKTGKKEKKEKKRKRKKRNLQRRKKSQRRRVNEKKLMKMRKKKNQDQRTHSFCSLMPKEKVFVSSFQN